MRVDSDVLDWILKTLLQEPWGIFAVSEADLETLWKRFQNLLTVESPEGEQLYFRYYDPRVLRPFLPTCIFDEINRFFGPVSCFLAKTDEPDAVVKISPGGQRAKEPVSFELRAEETPRNYVATAMLRIRKEQIEVFSVLLRQEANRRLASYVTERFPSEFKQTDTAILYELADKVRTAATHYGIDHENDIATFLDLSVMYGDEFHQAPWAADILRDNALAGASKMAVLRQRVRASGFKL